MISTPLSFDNVVDATQHYNGKKKVTIVDIHHEGRTNSFRKDQGIQCIS